MLYAFFWVITRLLNFICRRFGTLCLFHLHRRPWRWNRQSVPKRRHIKFRRWEITKKKAYNIQNREKVWNQEEITSMGRKMQETFDYSKNCETTSLWTECFETSEYKLQMPGNYPEKKHKIIYCCVEWNQNTILLSLILITKRDDLYK